MLSRRPFNLLLLTAVLLFLISLGILKKNEVVDIHLHDTYFVIAKGQVFRLLTAVGLVVWALYLFTNALMYSKLLSWIHVIITILTLLLLAGMLLFDDTLINPEPRQYYDVSPWKDVNPSMGLRNTVGLIIILLLPAQLIFVFNIFSGLFIKVFVHRKK